MRRRSDRPGGRRSQAQPVTEGVDQGKPAHPHSRRPEPQAPQLGPGSTGCWTVYGGTSAASPQTAATVALANAARSANDKPPIGFLDPILYRQGLGASAYNDVTPMHYGTAPPTFAGSDVGVGTVDKSVGDLVDNQLWENPVAGYSTTSGYDATTGWGTPRVNDFVASLTAMP